MKRPRLFVTQPFFLTLLIVCASAFSFGASGKAYAQQQESSSQNLYETAKRQHEAGAHRVLTESAIEAAQHITFEPAIKDGRPVSTASSIEYNFRTY